MGDKHNIIEVNGKRYDARTGKLLVGTASPATERRPKLTKKPTTGTVMDGFNRKATVRPLRTPTPTTAAHSIHTTAAKSKTLMRSAVQKPVASKPIHAKAVAASAAIPSVAEHRTATAPSMSPGRALRAKYANKSSLISKFGHELSKLPARSAVVPVVTAPGEPAAVITHKKPESQLFQRALEQATSHEQLKHKKQPIHHKVAKKLNVSTRLVNGGSALLAVMLLAGFFAYQNVPNLALRVASARAGVDGSMPSYRPSGYSVKGAIQYSPGQIVIAYGSHSDDREFKLTQRKSDWNNETLLTNFVAANKQGYQTYQSTDKTIYMYGGNSATWIENGVWYQIDGQQALSSDQLLRIAASL